MRSFLKANSDKIGRAPPPPMRRPSTYASFIIAPGFPPKIIAEDQDRFEFPDKKVTYRVKG